MEANKIQENVASGVATDLPDEIWTKIFSYLPKQDQHSVGIVSERFHNLIDSIKIEEDYVLKITDKNVKEIRAGIQNKNGKLNFKRVHMENVASIEDLKFILASIGKQIDELSMENTAAFGILNGNVKYIKSLTLYFDDVLWNSVSSKTWNLSIFLKLKKLTFVNNKDLTKQLLEQLKFPKTPLTLKYLKLDCRPSNEGALIDALLCQAKSIESLHIDFHSFPQNKNWEKLFFHIKNLMSLSLSGGVTDDFLHLFIKHFWNSLQSLALSNCYSITDVGFMEISKLNKLRVLKISNCVKLTNQGLQDDIAAENHPNMEELHLSNLPQFDEGGLETIVYRFPNLIVLHLDLKYTVPNAVLAKIFCLLIRLRVFFVETSLDIQDEGLIGFGDKPYSIKRLIHLEELYLGNCRHLTDRAYILALIFPKLRSLTLINSHKMTSTGIKNLVINCPYLEVLSISSYAVIDHNSNSLFYIANGLHRLRKLILNNCANLTRTDIAQIKEVFNALQDPITKTTFASKCELMIEN